MTHPSLHYGAVGSQLFKYVHHSAMDEHGLLLTVVDGSSVEQSKST